MVPVAVVGVHSVRVWRRALVSPSGRHKGVQIIILVFAFQLNHCLYHCFLVQALIVHGSGHVTLLNIENKFFRDNSVFVSGVAD